MCDSEHSAVVRRAGRRSGFFPEAWTIEPRVLFPVITLILLIVIWGIALMVPTVWYSDAEQTASISVQRGHGNVRSPGRTSHGWDRSGYQSRHVIRLMSTEAPADRRPRRSRAPRSLHDRKTNNKEPRLLPWECPR
jgi:hypothetical protein